MPPKTKELKLPAQLLNRIEGGAIDDSQWRDSHNIKGKRKSRKESRKEMRLAKKRKPNHTVQKLPRGQNLVENIVENNHKHPRKVEESIKVAKPSKKPVKSDKILKPFLSAHDEEVRKKDEADAKYYAKQLGLKSLKLKDTENDGLGDILGDLDFDKFSETNEEDIESPEPATFSEDDHDDHDDHDVLVGQSKDEEMTAEETLAKLAELKRNKYRSQRSAEDEDDVSVFDSEILSGEQSNSQLGFDDDSLSEGDFENFGDEDESDDESLSAEQTMAKLKALKSKSGQSAGNASSEDDLSESSSNEDEDENPYVPPKRRNVAEDTTNSEISTPKADSEAVSKIRRAFKGALNRLTEATLPQITNEIELAFVRNSRAEASEVLSEQLLELIDQPQPLQHTLYTVYGGLIAALYQKVGISFAAYFVQLSVERIVSFEEGAPNLLSLLIECYSLHVLSCRLPYDLMKHLLSKIESAESLTPVELLLLIIRNGGSQLRSDDPGSLKEIVVLLQQRMQQLGGTGQQLSPRMRFLVDAIVALKNNRQKPVSELVVSLRHRIRKALMSGVNTKNGESAKEAIQVGLGDILDSKSRGKWWLVGASWKGNQVSEENDKLDIDMDDEFGSSTPDWLELAKKQRLNTDIRRAVFVALMGAEDYLDACLRIDKLGLKNKQERDVPHVILHCLNQEPYYNPYYALVAGKQCTRHSTMKTFQFRLWDWLSSEPTGSSQTAMHYGRFFASLVHQKVMPLDVLKTADFLSGTQDAQIFLQFFCVTLYKELARQAEKQAKKSAHSGFGRIPGVSDIDRDGKELAIILSKVKEPTVLRGLQIMNQSLLRSEAIQTPKDRNRIKWATEFSSDLIEELVRKTD